MGILLRHLSVVASFLATTGIAVAQSYYHSPNDSLIGYTTVGNSLTLNITQVHPTNDTLLFVWKKLSVELPVEWTATICDNNTCYPTLIDSAQTLPVLPGDDGLMLIHCSPNTVSGIGVIRYTIQELSGSQPIDTLTWIIDATATASLDQWAVTATPFFILDQVLYLNENAGSFNQLKLINLSGELVFSRVLDGASMYELSGIHSGIYFIELSDQEHVIHQKIWLQNN